LNHGVFIPTGWSLAGNETRQAMYVLSRNIEALSCSHCCHVKALSITYSECVSVGLVCSMNSACVVWYCHLRPFWLYHIFPHYLLKGTTFGKTVTEHKMCVLIFFTTFVWNISHSEKNSER
jgi:hypothetical protein